MILANMSVPLLGLVDTAVIGHLSDARFLAAIALGSSTVTVLFWLLGFLRMSTTGAVAEAFGSAQSSKITTVLLASSSLALVLALLLGFLQQPIVMVMGYLAQTSAEVQQLASEYVAIRLFAAPAVLLNLVLLGALLGLQFGKGPFYVVLFSNGLNIVLDIWFVVGLGLGVQGAAWASCIAEYASLLLALWLLRKVLWQQMATKLRWQWPRWQQLVTLLALNRDIFLRSLILQACFSYMTFYAARLGDITLAANAVLLNFLLLVSFAMDGLAYALEAKVGHANGQRNLPAIQLWVKLGFVWGGAFALCYALLFATLGGNIIALLTDLPEVQAHAERYLGWLVVLPLLATSAFLFDGIFIGLMRGHDMRNSMLVSGLVGFVLPAWGFSSYGNHALWLAMCAFMLLRGLTLAYLYRKWMDQRPFSPALAQND
ncbi:MATE family efflux transporter [Pseudoalteromonas fenneropenaei]|uniref:MATE family efflux transporter n=1 Tax=Pseudoalteromonas fenneropenaei TaxID=1737459 RepID=A0ABV7CQ68_9GAMM